MFYPEEVIFMKIAVVCANGKAGTRIVNEAVQRRLDVTAVVRGENCSNTKRVIQKDLFDLTTNDLKEFDVVIDAFGAWTDETLSPFLFTKNSSPPRIYFPVLTPSA